MAIAGILQLSLVLMRRSAAASSGGGRSVYTIGSIVAVAWFTCVSLFSVMCSVIELKRKWIGRLLEPLGLRVSSYFFKLRFVTLSYLLEMLVLKRENR